MEACHGHGTYEPRAEDIHLFVEAVIDHEIVRHTDTVGFHGMALAVVVVAHLGVVEVRDAASGGVGTTATATTTTTAAASTSGGGDARGRGGGGGGGHVVRVGVVARRRSGGGGGTGDSGGR